MSFEMQYDAHGRPKKNQELEKLVTTPELSLQAPAVDPQPEALEAAENYPHEQEQPEPVELRAPQPTVDPLENAKANVLRKKASEYDRIARERDELARQIQEMKASKAQPAAQDDDTDFSIANDELAEGKHLNKVKKEMKSLRDELKKQQQQNYITSTELRLKTEYPDFYAVVNQDNLAALREAEPYLAESIGNDPDAYRQMVSAYRLIKKVGIHKEDTFTQDKALVQKNAAKPKPMASIAPQQGDSPLSRANAFANGLTKELKAQLWKEMEQYKL